MSLLSPGQPPRVASPIPIAARTSNGSASEGEGMQQTRSPSSFSTSADGRLHAPPRTALRGRTSIDSLSSLSSSVLGAGADVTITSPPSIDLGQAAWPINGAAVSPDAPPRYTLHVPTAPGSAVNVRSGTADYVPLDARYVTVSSILSRSGAALLIPSDEHGDALPASSSRSTPHHRSRARRKSLTRTLSSIDAAGESSSLSLTKEQRRPDKRASNGSALEALGALFLRRDSSGKVSNLSFLRHSLSNDKDDDAGEQTSRRSARRTRRGDRSDGGGAKSTFSSGVSSVSRAWLDGVAGAKRLGISMPRSYDAGQTIAQRRARKTLSNGNDTRRTKTGANDLTFEVTVANPAYPPVPPQAPLRSKAKRPLEIRSPPPAPRLMGVHNDILTPLDLQSEEMGRAKPRTILRPAARPSSDATRGVYGPGSAFSLIDPPELPPSPIGMPGAWMLGSGGRWSKDRMDEEGALLLPPPLLDDNGSDAKSFEGLLGVRRMREQERARKQLEKLKARNRPAHKIGMLTAFSNFVKAAHAADRASRAATHTDRIPLKRRHTEPVDASALMTMADDDEDDELDAERPDTMLVDATSMRRSGSLRRTSMDSSGRQLDTVYEARSPDAAEDGNEVSWISDELDKEAAQLASSRSASSGDSPRAARHVRVRLSGSMDESKQTGSSLDVDSISPGSLSGPNTPRLGPTLLSLPPSPWSPHGGSAGLRSGQQTPFHVQLGMTSISGPPGTPRLIPALLEVLPSPLPALDGSSDGMIAPSPLALTPREAPPRAASSTAARRPNGAPRRRTAPSRVAGHDRLTPTASMDMLAEDSKATPTRKRKSTGEAKGVSLGIDKPPAAQGAANRRSFLLWFLFGDLGLGARSTIAAKASGSPAPTAAMRYSQAYNALLSLAAHVYGFAVFVLAHLVDLGYRIAEFLSMTFWFARWMTLNLTGQTVLARCAIDAYQIVSREWETVSKEDHEKKGRKENALDGDDDEDVGSGKMAPYRGLSRWQVLKGLIELVCLQAVTRERYLQQGAGLEEITGWQRVRRGRREKHSGDGGVERSAANKRGAERIDLGAMRATDREAKDWRAAHTHDDESDDEHSSDSESSDDDDMVVTRRGADILEFTKTPKVEMMHGYFSSSDDGDAAAAPHVGLRSGSQRRTWSAGSSHHRAAEEPVNRQLVKLIKWASRLAISAYGLHVTLVDLPATFTPSGERFSRQTFAHLSRLHHEDVLHADIQTLDSDDYSPTFYLVRDLTRRVVVVSVRGTQSLQDIIVDLEMVVDQVKLHNEDLEKVPDEALFCHAGVLRAAQALIAPDSTLFRTLSEALKENPDFGIVFTGHSLGGAIASTVVLLLSRFEKASTSAAATVDGEDDEGQWLTHDRSGLPAGRAIRAITFAHPATVSANLAARAARGTTPLVLSVVLGHDIIPRCGHGQARELRRVLGALSRVRKRREGRRHGRRRGSVSSVDTDDEAADVDVDVDERVHIVTSWWRWRSIKRKGTAASREERLRAHCIERELWHLRCDVENDLYSAVKRRTEEARQKVRMNGGNDDDGGDGEPKNNGDANDESAAMVHSRSSMPSIPPSPWIGPSQRAKAPLHQLAARRQALDAVTLANEESISKSAGVLVPAGRSIWLYEGSLYRITSPLSFFSLPDFHARMFSEHFPSAYEDWLEKL